MRSIIRKIWSMVSPVQVLSVFLSFALMVFLSYNFMSDIERKNLLDKVNNTISHTQDTIVTELHESEILLGVISETVRGMIIAGSSFEMAEEYIAHITEYLMKDTQCKSIFNGVYAFFDVFGGRFCGNGFTPLIDSEDAAQADFDPQNMPWYSAAVEASGSVAQTEPVMIKDSESTVIDVSITFARRIFDDNGNPLGIVCLDIPIRKIQNNVITAYVTEGSYGILFDKELNVIAHPVPGRFLGRNLGLMNDGEAIKEILMSGESIFERKVWDYNRKESVGFFHKLDNGWYLGIIAYADEFYKVVSNIGFILSLMGFVLAVVLSAILLSVISGRKKAEERIKLMLDATPLCVNIWDKNYQNIDCNMEAVKLFELSGKKEYFERFNDLSPKYQPDGRISAEKSRELTREAFEKGYKRFEWTHCKLNGELIPCEITLVRVKFRNEDMICGYIRDLREIKEMMAKMREADERTKVLLDATPLSCFMIDTSLKILESNQEVVRLFGLKNKKEFIENVFRFFPEYQPSGEQSEKTSKKNVYEAFEEGFCRFEWMHQDSKGEQIPTEVSLVRVKFMGEYVIAGYIRDLREIKKMIAEMRRAEIAEESNKAKSDFLAKMSHEIRTPMNAIMGITEIQLQDYSLSLATKEALERIYNSGDLLLGIINDILDLSKIEAGKLELSGVQYDIASLIFDAAKLNLMRYESKPIDFKLEIDEKTPSTLAGDELRIKQILNNLLSNAFKYTQEGRIILSLSAEQYENDSACNLVIKVSDTGQGMTEDQVKRLGDKFSRFNTDVNRKTEGTGLGMNITRNLIQLMHGEMTVESTPGLGSVFTVNLPQQCVNQEPIGRELAENLMKLNLKNTTKMRNAQITQEYMPYGRVLVVDDVETNLYVARGLLSPYGMSIDTGLSGLEAIEKVKKGCVYDIIFMDHMMPGMDGIKAAEIIRTLGYTKPIVALTANALSGQAEMFMDKGFDDFISKPIDIRQLNNVLNRLIRDKQTPETLNEARRQKNILYASGSHNIAIDPQLAEFFVRDAKKAAAVLTAICENSCRRADDIPTMIINVHAMKSALLNIGEKDLSEAASRLEQTGRDKDVNLILLSLPEFITSLHAVIEKLQPSEDDLPEAENSFVSDGKEYLHDKLQTILDACQSLNKKTAKEALADLKQKTWPRSTRERLSAIAEHLLHTEFDEVASIAKTMMNEQ